MLRIPQPTRLERCLNARIDLRVFGIWLGTGNHIYHARRARAARGDDTDSEASSDEDPEALEYLFDV